MRHPILVVLVTGLVLLAACGRKEAEKPPEKVTNITTAVVVSKDLPVTESAVGSTTSLSAAQVLDPTQVQRGTFTIRLPFPEHIARKLRIGQTVRLTSFDDPNRAANARVKEIRPALNSTTQTMEVIAELPGGREWYSVGSVRGEVVLGVRRGAHVVPEQAVVLRPAGSVVYVPQGETVKERAVKPGILRDGEREIVEGLQAGETVAVDGAGLLSDGAKVRVVTASTAPGGNKP
jgi:membrane fusion protein, multidrug efflux system